MRKERFKAVEKHLGCSPYNIYDIEASQLYYVNWVEKIHYVNNNYNNYNNENTVSRTRARQISEYVHQTIGYGIFHMPTERQKTDQNQCIFTKTESEK